MTEPPQPVPAHGDGPQPIDPDTMRRLGFIRLLYQHGVAQSEWPEPLSAQAVLSLHDASELVLGVAADTLGASLPLNIEFMAYWSQLAPNRLPRGVDLPARQRMRRVNGVRNELKHHGTLPSLGAIRQVRADVTVFIEDTIQLLFGTPLASIDMTDVIPQPDARARLKAAAAAEFDGDRKEAMAQLAEAFGELFRPYVGSPFGSAMTYGFGPTVRGGPGFPVGMSSAMAILGRATRSNQTSGLQVIGRKVDEHLAQLEDVVAAMQRGMRVMAVGIDYARYSRFQALTPNVSGTGEYRRVNAEYDYAPTREEYDECVGFVVSVALRLAELETATGQPSWRLARN